MSTFRELERRSDAIFTKVGTLQGQLRGIPNARSTFAIENGMEYCTNAELSKIIVRAAKKSLMPKENQASQQIIRLAPVLDQCIKNLQQCEEVIRRAMQERSWSPSLEEEISISWKMFCVQFFDACMILEVRELDLCMLIGKPEHSTSKKPDEKADADTRSVSTATDQSWHSKGSFMRLFRSRNQHNKRNKFGQSQNIGSNPIQVSGPSTHLEVPDNIDAISDPGPSSLAEGINKDPRRLSPSVRSRSPPPQYSDLDTDPSLKQNPPRFPGFEPPSQQPAPILKDPQGPLSRFSTRFDLIPPAQPGAQTFVAEHIHMYHGCPPTQYPGSMYPSGPPPIAAWQPVWQRPPPTHGPPLLVPPPLSYKSSVFSLRETLATEFLNLIKPDVTCVHQVLHYKSHASCPWGCCWQRGCFAGH